MHPISYPVDFQRYVQIALNSRQTDSKPVICTNYILVYSQPFTANAFPTDNTPVELPTQKKMGDLQMHKKPDDCCKFSTPACCRNDDCCGYEKALQDPSCSGGLCLIAGSLVFCFFSQIHLSEF